MFPVHTTTGMATHGVIKVHLLLICYQRTMYIGSIYTIKTCKIEML